MAATKGARCFENEEYLFVDALQLTLTKENTHEDGSFTLCFWMYLLKSSKPGCIIRQFNSKTQASLPFLTIDHDLRLTLHPLRSQEASSYLIVGDQSCPFDKWVHLGCEVGQNIARLHMDGVITGEKPLSFCQQEEGTPPVILSGGDGTKNVQAYAHHICAVPQPSVTNHYVKNPPLELSLDGSTGETDDHEVEEGGDGVWSVVGGKASCRRNFALDVVLLDALGRSVHKDIEIVASLVYADTASLVEKPKDDAEAPLLTTFDGVEFPSTERPIKLVHGRASFKLKISQLSSKCDNRLFRVCFESPNAPKFPFLRVLSRPIRCVSRNRNSRTPSAPWKRSLTAVYPVEGTDSPGRDDKAESTRLTEVLKSAGPPKVQRTGEERVASVASRFQTPERAVEFKGNVSAVLGAKAASHLPVTSSQHKQQHGQHVPEIGKALSFPDYLVFKYCLETVHSRAVFLRGAVSSRSEEDLNELATRVSQCTGCHHNAYQVSIAKSLIEDGAEVWRQLIADGTSVSWNKLLSKLEDSFRQISGRTRRRFTEKDGDFMQGICGCGCGVEGVEENVTREEFDRVWQWMYPVALTVSSSQVRTTWEDDHTKWIQGMICRKRSEELLKSVEGLPKPGTFILRFATRFWPHPDAGAMVVSYVAPDLRIHHRLLNIDVPGACLFEEVVVDGGKKPQLSELLLSHPQLTRPLSF